MVDGFKADGKRATDSDCNGHCSTDNSQRDDGHVFARTGWEVSTGGKEYQFKKFWAQLEKQGWRVRVRKLPRGRLDKMVAGDQVVLAPSLPRSLPHLSSAFPPHAR